MENFQQWLQNSTTDWPQPGHSLVRLASVHSGERGLVCNADIRANSPILTIPLSDLRFILTPERCVSLLNSCGCFQNASLCLSNCLYAITLFVYHTRYPVFASCPVALLWKPYIDVLPTSYTDPVFILSKYNVLTKPFPNDVKSGDLKAKLTDALRRLRDAWSNLSPLLNSTHSNEPPLEFVWAWCCVNSRCVYCKFREDINQLVRQSTKLLRVPPKAYRPSIVLKDCKQQHFNVALIPVFDMINHDPNRIGKLEVDRHASILRFSTSSELKSGEQVLFSYGPHDNLTLFIEYGFCIRDNPNDALYPSYMDLVHVLTDFGQSQTPAHSRILCATLTRLGLCAPDCENESPIWPTVCISKDGLSYHLKLLLYSILRHAGLIDPLKLSRFLDDLFSLDLDVIDQTIRPVVSLLTATLIEQVKSDDCACSALFNQLAHLDSNVKHFFAQLRILYQSKRVMLHGL